MIKERKFNQEPGALIQARLHPSLLSPSLPSAPTPTGLCSLRGVASPGRVPRGLFSSCRCLFRWPLKGKAYSGAWGRVAGLCPPETLVFPSCKVGIGGAQSGSHGSETKEPFRSGSPHAFHSFWIRFQGQLGRQSPLFTESQSCHLEAALSGP